MLVRDVFTFSFKVACLSILSVLYATRFLKRALSSRYRPASWTQPSFQLKTLQLFLKNGVDQLHGCLQTVQTQDQMWFVCVAQSFLKHSAPYCQPFSFFFPLSPVAIADFYSL